MADAPFRTVVGVVEFDPREGNAGGKAVRNITISQTGFKENAIKIGATLWPSFDHIDVAKGDVVVARGKFTRNEGEKNGEKVFYNNLSVSSFAVIASMDEGQRVEVENADEPAGDDYDDIPY